MAKRKVPKSVRSRAKKIARRRFRRQFGEQFLKDLGYSSKDFRKGGIIKKKLGLFGGPITAGVPGASAGAAGPGPAPAVELPERENKETNPSITTIVSQLNKLVKTASKVGILTKEQQDAMLGQISQARRIAKEQLQEAKPAIVPEGPQPGNTSDSLAPLGDVIQKLSEQLNKLTETVKEKNEESEDDGPTGTFMERFMENMGYGDQYKARQKRKAARAARVDPSELVDVRGNPLEGERRERLVRRIQAERATRPGLARRAMGGIKQAGSKLMSSRIGEAISSRASRAAAGSRLGGGSIRSAIRTAAGPIIAKSLGSTALKTIPVVGALVGGGLAVKRLMEGDPVGAGLDLMSGLGSVVTAIPALIASVARDVYSSVYGVPPESDPELSKRMPEVKSAVEDLVKEQLGDKVKPKQKPGADAVDKLTIPKTPQVKPQAVKQNAPQLGTPPAPQAAAATRKASPTGQSAPAPAPEKSSGPASGAAAAMQEGVAAGAAGAMVGSASAKTGAEIMQAAVTPPPPPDFSMYGFDNTMQRFVPQTMPTPVRDHMGIGTVPNPDYVPSIPATFEDLYKVMFFNVNYQEQ